MVGIPAAIGRRIGTRLARLTVIGAIAAVALVVTPGTASAAGSITPIFDCYRDNGDGTYWAVLGYTNSATRPTIPLGAQNQMFPAALNGGQPTTFETGTVHGAFAVRVSLDQVFNQNARWVLDGRTLQYSSAVTYGTVCPASTQLPATGNGWGPAMASGAAGLAGSGVLLLEVWRRRRRTRGAPSDAVA
ncbi:hypothetical protein [Blastococcus sp. URHD0036]|uniref:hypothetical protein n=1 Tax=Blastococcus sp. URHD0036 TaxID=1380356 RepID=UPI0012DBD9A4|nr:hypothetical protein [Blastococcus sp. URHD0036]